MRAHLHRLPQSTLIQLTSPTAAGRRITPQAGTVVLSQTANALLSPRNTLPIQTSMSQLPKQALPHPQKHPIMTNNQQQQRPQQPLQPVSTGLLAAFRTPEPRATPTTSNR